MRAEIHTKRPFAQMTPVTLVLAILQNPFQFSYRGGIQISYDKEAFAFAQRQYVGNERIIAHIPFARFK